MKVAIFEQYVLNEGLNDEAVNIEIDYHDFQMLKNNETLSRDLIVSHTPSRTIHFTIRRKGEG